MKVMKSADNSETQVVTETDEVPADWTHAGDASRYPEPGEYWDDQAGDWALDPVQAENQMKLAQASDKISMLDRIIALEHTASLLTPYNALQMVNSGILDDVNPSAATALPLDTVDHNIGEMFSANGNAIETGFDGLIRLSASIYMITAIVQRASVLCQWARNGQVFGPKFDTSYIRRASGDNESSCACTPFIASCSDGDMFTLTSVADAASGLVNLHGVGQSYMLAERVG